MLVVTFLAILELARETLVQVTQQGAFSPIYVKLNHGLAVCLIWRSQDACWKQRC